jgi:hypothetical protein
MTDPARRHRTVTRRRALLLLAVAAVLLAGCDLATGTVRTATELQKAGIDNPHLDYDRSGTATLDYDADPNPLEARAEQDRAAAIIWDNLPFRIDRITVNAKGGVFPGRREYPRALLEQQLGPRPANLDRSVSDIARRASLIAVLVALVVLALIVVVVVVVVRAVRRPAVGPAGLGPARAARPAALGPASAAGPAAVEGPAAGPGLAGGGAPARGRTGAATATGAAPGIAATTATGGPATGPGAGRHPAAGARAAAR